MARTYFAILGVTSAASSEEIRSAYRRLAKECHPDHSGGDSSAFRQIQEAYSVLSDQDRRRQYERSLTESPRAAPRRYRSPEPSAPRRRGFPMRHFATFEAFIDELLGRGRFEPSFEQVRNFTLQVPFTEELAQRGGRLEVTIPARTVCPSCGGNGDVGFYACSRCLGQGAVLEDLPLSISLPPGMQAHQTVVIALDRFGLPGARLTVVLVDG